MGVSKGNIRKVQNEFFLEEVCKHLLAGKMVKMSIVGESMKPFLKGGDQVILKPIQEKHLSVGHIVLATNNNTYVLHRLVGKKKDKLMLAGDANYSQVEYVTCCDIKAVIIQAYRKDVKLSVSSWQSRIAGLLWYKMRMYRRIYNKLIKI